jgi:hypothetical protein
MQKAASNRIDSKTGFKQRRFNRRWGLAGTRMSTPETWMQVNYFFR